MAEEEAEVNVWNWIKGFIVVGRVEGNSLNDHIKNRKLVNKVVYDYISAEDNNLGADSTNRPLKKRRK